MPHYEVHHYTFCEGWQNTWSIENDNGDMVPETFDTHAEAQAALDEFFAEIADEITDGNRPDDAGYDRNEFKIVYIP